MTRAMTIAIEISRFTAIASSFAQDATSHATLKPRWAPIRRRWPGISPSPRPTSGRIAARRGTALHALWLRGNAQARRHHAPCRRLIAHIRAAVRPNRAMC
jgi:hypothetical protein